MSASTPEATLAWQLRACGIAHELEVRFHPTRRWRIDIACGRLAIEIEGGAWIQGRHSRGYGVEADCEKSAHLAMAGYRLMRVTPRQVRDGRALAWIREAVERAPTETHFPAREDER